MTKPTQAPAFRHGDSCKYVFGCGKMKPYRGTHGNLKPVERARTSRSTRPSEKQESPGFSRGERQEHSESPKHYTILLHPQPDEMTFEQSVMHVRRTMYWDYLDGYWCDISLYPLGKWKLLEEQLKAAHEREMKQLEEKNKELVCKLMTLESEFMDWIGQYDPTDAYVRKAQEENEKLRDLVSEMLICKNYILGDAFDLYGCEGCPLHAGECNFEARAKELRIETER